MTIRISTERDLINWLREKAKQRRKLTKKKKKLTSKAEHQGEAAAFSALADMIDSGEVVLGRICNRKTLGMDEYSTVELLEILERVFTEVHRRSVEDTSPSPSPSPETDEQSEGETPDLDMGVQELPIMQAPHESSSTKGKLRRFTVMGPQSDDGKREVVGEVSARDVGDALIRMKARYGESHAISVR